MAHSGSLGSRSPSGTGSPTGGGDLGLVIVISRLAALQDVDAAQDHPLAGLRLKLFSSHGAHVESLCAGRTFSMAATIRSGVIPASSSQSRVFAHGPSAG